MVASPPILPFPFLSPMNLVFMPDTPEAAAHAQHRRDKSYPVRTPITLSSLQTNHVARNVVFDGMRVVNTSVEEVEDVARDDRCEGHGAPVLTQAMYAETVRY